MRSRGGLRRWPRKQQPHSAAREATARIHRILAQGCTPEELEQAQAELDAMNQPRQPQLPLKIRP